MSEQEILATSPMQVANSADVVLARSAGYHLLGVMLLLLFAVVPILLIIVNIIKGDLW